MNSEYPCRTKTISGKRHIVTIYRKDDKTKVVSVGCNTEEHANRTVERYLQNPQYYCEIALQLWTEEVCIECGQEAY